MTLAVKAWFFGSAVILGRRTVLGSTRAGPIRNDGDSFVSASDTQSRASRTPILGSSPQVACAAPPGIIRTVSRTSWPGLAISGCSESSTNGWVMGWSSGSLALPAPSTVSWRASRPLARAAASTSGDTGVNLV